MAKSDIIKSEAAGRYAKALLGLAEDAKSLKTVEKNLATVKKLFADNESIWAMAASPVYATEDKVNALLAIAAKAKLGKIVTNFIGLVAQNRRAAEIPAMIKEFDELLARRRGTQIAKVTSAKKLTGAQMSKLKSQLKKSLGRAVDVEADVDPDLLGGFVVSIGSRLYDSSLKTKIEDLKLALKEA